MWDITRKMYGQMVTLSSSFIVIVHVPWVRLTTKWQPSTDLSWGQDFCQYLGSWYHHLPLITMIELGGPQRPCLTLQDHRSFSASCPSLSSLRGRTASGVHVWQLRLQAWCLRVCSLVQWMESLRSNMSHTSIAPLSSLPGGVCQSLLSLQARFHFQVAWQV